LEQLGHATHELYVPEACDRKYCGLFASLVVRAEFGEEGLQGLHTQNCQFMSFSLVFRFKRSLCTSVFRLSLAPIEHVSSDSADDCDEYAAEQWRDRLGPVPKVFLVGSGHLSRESAHLAAQILQLRSRRLGRRTSGCRVLRL
jgi:hypothetical protein